MSELPELPGGEEPPSADALAERLATLFEDHEAARDALVPIVAAALSGVDDHPRPRRLAEVVYEDLGERIMAADDREAELEALQLRSLAGHAQSLAVARYLSDHPDAAGRAGAFLDAEAESWRQRGAEAIAAEASKALEALEDQSVRGPDYLHAKLALGSARTGAFGTAAGPLHDFLKLMGAPGERLDIH